MGKYVWDIGSTIGDIKKIMSLTDSSAVTALCTKTLEKLYQLRNINIISIKDEDSVWIRRDCD